MGEPVTTSEPDQPEPPGPEPVVLPAGLGAAVRAEWGRALRAPYEMPLVVFGNAALLLGAWWFLPHTWITDLHGPFALPLVLSSWMYADVTATNLVGDDARRMLVALDDPVMVHRLFVAKNIVLWCLATPIAALTAVIVGVREQQGMMTVLVIIGLMTVPFGPLGVAAWLGVWFPYHPIALAERWRGRRPLRQKVWRWGALVLAPYVLVPAVAGALLVPSAFIWRYGRPETAGRLSDGDFATGGAVAVVIAFVAWWAGHRVALRFVARRREQLRAYLADPSLG